MTIDVYTATGEKNGTMELPATLFAATINRGLMHQAFVRQLANARHPIAHAKRRSEVEGSTKKLYQQKHTGQARRGGVRSPLLRGGGKSFGPRSDQNFSKDMPRAMRRAALFSCLSLQAKRGAILGLEGYPQEIATKKAVSLLQKLPTKDARHTLIVLPGKHDGLTLSTRNIPGVLTVQVGYLNPRDILAATKIVFVADAVQKAEEMFGKKSKRIQRMKKSKKKDEPVGVAAVEPKKKAPKKTATKKIVKAKSSTKKSS